jgi:hypothetical protein
VNEMCFVKNGYKSKVFESKSDLQFFNHKIFH